MSLVLVGGVLLGALLLPLALPRAGVAAPSTTPTSAAIEELKAEEAEARVQLELTRIDLATLVAEYIEMGSELDKTRRDIVQVTDELAGMQVKLEKAEETLANRAIELYRGDRDSMLSLILTSKSVQDLWVRSSYLAKINFRDSRLVNDVRLARQENLWLQKALYDKAERLDVLQRDADAHRSKIESDLAAQEERAERLRIDIARAMWAPGGASAPQGGFNPETVISEAQFRDANALTVDTIQTFLEEQPGTLATYRTRDYAGKVKSVAEMVFEAGQAWGVNPKVILVKLQKEQSLLERGHPTGSAYDWAMGCGRPDSGARYTQYQGFGKQVWFGAEKLAKNGGPWSPGISMKIDGSTIHPTNAATYSLFKYTPHFRGTMSFWMLYWRYFGDPSV